MSDCLGMLQQLTPNMSEGDVQSWLNEDSSDVGYQLLTDDEIVQYVTECSDSSDEDDRLQEATQLEIC